MNNYVQFVKAHERIIIVIAVALMLWGISGKWIEHKIQMARLNASISQQALNTQAEKNKLVADQAQKDELHAKLLVAQLQTQNKILDAAIKARDNGLTAQQNTDKTLPSSELADRWKFLLKTETQDYDHDITILPDSYLSVSDSASRATVEKLESVPVLKKNYEDQQAETGNWIAQSYAKDQTISDLHVQVDGLNTQIKDADKNCQNQITLVKADSRKKSRSWFLKGILTGAGLVAYILR